MKLIVDQAEELAKYYFKPEDDKLFDPNLQPITKDFDESYPCIVDRFFTRYYYVKNESKFAPYQVLVHSNRICLICLAPEHPAFGEGIESLNFDIGGFDRSKNCTTGKGKKGAMVLQEDTTLALLKTKKGFSYKIPSCIRSKLIEVNLELSKNLHRLETADEAEGYIAIVLPKMDREQEFKEFLMTEDDYKEYLLQMKENTSNISVQCGNDDVEM